jgi:hypothetical protein
MKEDMHIPLPEWFQEVRLSFRKQVNFNLPLCRSALKHPQNALKQPHHPLKQSSGMLC